MTRRIVALALALLMSQLFLRNLKFRILFCGTPSILIRNGIVQQEELRKNRYTLDELLEELRGQGISTIGDVKYAVLETNGQLSILPYTKEAPITPLAADLAVKDRVTLPILVINDGHVMEDNLLASGHDKKWLTKQLSKRKLKSPREVFLMTVDEENTVICVAKEENS